MGSLGSQPCSCPSSQLETKADGPSFAATRSMERTVLHSVWTPSCSTEPQGLPSTAKDEYGHPSLVSQGA